MKPCSWRDRAFTLCLAAVCLTGPAACSGGDDAARGPAPAPVHVRPVTRADMPRVLSAVGNVRASATVGVTPRVTGELLDVRFTEGQEVKAGDPLLLIDPRPFEAALREKRAVLAKSEAQLAKANDDRRRYGKLVGGGYVSREAYEQTATDAAALRATVQADRAAVESAALDLAYCTVTAPIGGRAGALTVDKGNMVKSTDATPVVTIDTLSPIYVTFSVPEAQLPVILERMQGGAIPVTATPTGGSPETGRLTLVDNSVDTRTGTIRLRATFENPGRRLWPGQFVQVALPLGVAEDALVVPSRAVQSGREERYVYLVDADGRAVYRPVTPLFEHEGQTVVADGLENGDRVVIDGQVRLAPGLPVKILD